jgi:hypothetical protein
VNEPLEDSDTLNQDEVIELLGEIEHSLTSDSPSLPDQHVLRLWWGTERDTAGPLASGVGPIYGDVLDWQEGLISLPEARASMTKHVRALLSQLRPSSRSAALHLRH